VEFGIGPDLRRLEHHDHEPLAAAARRPGCSITAARLDPDRLTRLPFAAMPSNTAWPSDVSPPATAAAALDRYVELDLPVSIPAQIVICFVIFVDPSL